MNSAPNSAACQPINILIVEDSSDDALLLVHELKSSGFEPQWQRVDTEPDYRARLGEHLDAVFSDFSLPAFSTPKALEILRESRLDVPFIIVSGTIGEERAVECLKAGAVDYVLKNRLNRVGPALERALRETRERKERQRAEATLRESEARFRQLAENINEVFWITNADKSEMIYVSPAYATIWGRTCESLYAQPRNWIDAVHPDDRPRVQQTALTQQRTGNYQETYRIVRPDNSIRWIRDRAFPVYDKTGQVGRIVGTAEDITEQIQLEEQLRQAQKMEAIGQLAGGVAHDFNNLLAVIHCNAELMQMDAAHLKAEDIECLQQIINASERAAGLTRQLLAFSRKQIMQLKPLNLNDAIANLTKMLHRIIGEHIHLQCKYAAPLPLIQADLGMIDQIVLNLSVNARDAMSHGGDLTIVTSVESIDPEYVQVYPQAHPGEHVCLAVTDTGCGIRPEIMSRIFEPFFTTKEVGRGTGLGLATVYGIVQQHRGWINVYSEAGHGTVFRIYFPALPEAGGTAQKTTTAAAVRGGSETILLVEDETQLRGLARSVLERRGYKVLEASSGVRALEVWRAHRDQIHLVLTDMILPEGLSGRELVQTLRQEKARLPVVYTSGYSAGVDGNDFAEQQRMVFLQKPYSPTTLAGAVRSALDS